MSVMDFWHFRPPPRTIIVINEPDLKIPGISKPDKFCKAIISAIDGMLDAEKACLIAFALLERAGVDGVNLSVTHGLKVGILAGSGRQV